MNTQQPGARKAAQPFEQPTADQQDYLKKIQGAEYDPNVVVGGPSKAAQRTFNPLDAGVSIGEFPEEEAAQPAEGLKSYAATLEAWDRFELSGNVPDRLDYKQFAVDIRGAAAEIERLHAIIHGMQDGALVRDQAAQIERLRAQNAEMLAALKAINVSGPDADGLLWIEFRPLNTRAVGAVSVRAEQLVGQTLALWSEDRNAAITRAEGRQP